MPYLLKIKSRISKSVLIHLVFLLCFLVTSNIALAQDAVVDGEADTKTWIFTQKERDSMQIWFYNRATIMGLEEKNREEFYNIILYHSYKMRNLEKKENGYSPTEIRTRFEELLQKQHGEVRAILNNEQYNYYLDTYNKLLKGVYSRKGWE